MFVVVALLGLASSPASAQLVDSSLSRIAGGVRFYPGALYSSTVGIGIGLGYEFEGLLGRNSSLLLIAKPSIHRGIYELSYTTQDPRAGKPYVHVAAYYEDTGRTRFYGLGPFSDGDRRVFIDDEFLRLRFTGGIPLERGRWIVQPLVEFVNVDIDSFRNDDAEAFERMFPESQASLVSAAAFDGSVRWGAAGIELGRYFARDPARSGSSIQFTLERWEPIDADGEGFFRTSGAVLFDEAVAGRQIIGRIAYSAVTGTDDVPYFLLPRLGSRLLPGFAKYRFRGNSMLVANAAVEQPLFSLYDYAGIDLVLTAGVGSVYDHFGDQFTPRISFDDRIEPGGRAPLRPAAGAGFRIYVGERPLEVTVIAGFSAERTSLVTFRVHRDIRHRQGLLFR
ncbi:MAG TPA: hypothetical protein VF190_15305 [Rhodothermales bacterium]